MLLGATCHDVRIMHRAVCLGANGDASSCALAKDDDCSLRVVARRFGVHVVRCVEFAVLVFLQRAGVLFFGAAPRRLNRYKMRPRSKFAVDVGRDFDLVARRI